VRSDKAAYPFGAPPVTGMTLKRRPRGLVTPRGLEKYGGNPFNTTCICLALESKFTNNFFELSQEKPPQLGEEASRGDSPNAACMDHPGRATCFTAPSTMNLAKGRGPKIDGVKQNSF